MHLTLNRLKFNPKATIGAMLIDDEPFCITLEDRARPEGIKIQDETAIPAGTYKVIVNLSQRFQKMMPRLLDVPMFTGILIHSGNTDVDTKGCIVVGHTQDGDDHIHGGSVIAPKLMEKLNDAIANGEDITITINNCDLLCTD